MRAEIVTVGTELLLGQIVDSNSSWIAEQLAAAGVDVHFATKVGDNHERMVAVIALALERADVVVVTGGLGPTQDDVTREAVAAVTGRPLVRLPEVADRIRAMFDALGREMVESNLRQADVPEGAEWIPMVRGTAPGLVVPVGEGVIYAVPGVPQEMEEMVRRAVLPDVVARMGEAATIRSRVLKCWGTSESRLAEMLAPRFDALAAPGGLPGDAGVTLAFLAGLGVVRVRLTVKAASEAAATRALDAEEDACRAILGEVVFGVDDDTLEGVCIGALARRGWTLAAAESMTGGMVGEWLTRVPGASGVFAGSAVTYAVEAKRSLLGVPEGVLAEHGPVSETVASAMATGARRVFGTDVGVSVTGSAGPDAQGSAVGQSYLGIDVGGDVQVVGVRFPGERERVRTFATATLLDLLRRRLAAVGG